MLRPAPEGAGLFWLLRLPALTRAGLVPCLLAASAAGAAPLHPQAPPGIHGRVQDTAGIPIAGATVRLEDTPFAAVTDAEGRYALDGLGAGRHRLTVHAVGFDTAERRLNVPREGEALRLDLVLARGVPLLEEVVTLVAAAEAPEGGARHVLRRSDLARAGSLPRALARVPGVFVKDYGPGGPRQVSIRGADPQQTLVLWGEERLLAPGGTGFDLATLPLQAIDSIEVIGRGASSRWGEGAVGGVVRIHSSAIEPARGGVASLEGGVGAGSFGARDGALRAALELGGARLGVSASAASYEESFGRAAVAGGDQWAAALGLGLPRPGLSLSTTVQRADRAAPGPVFSPTPGARAEDRRALVEARLERTLGAWELRAGGAFQRAESGFADPARPAADARSRESSASVRASVARGGTHRRVEAGLELREDRGSGTDLEATTSRRDAALHAGLRWRPGAGALVLSPALRIDRLEMGTGAGQGDARSHSFVSPSLAAAVALRPGVSLRAFAGRAFRYPGFQSLAFVPGLGVRGNPHLREERSRDLELGLDWAPDPRVGASLAAYERRIDGPIVWLPDFRFVWSPRNLPRALVRGVDLAARWSSSAGLEATLAYTYAPARFDFPGNRHPLPYRPAHLGRLGMALERGAVHTAVDLRLTGRRHPTLAGTNALPAHAVLDWSLAWRRARAEHGELVLELALQNLLERRYEVVAGFPAAGRTLRVGARAALP